MFDFFRRLSMNQWLTFIWWLLCWRKFSVTINKNWVGSANESFLLHYLRHWNESVLHSDGACSAALFPQKKSGCIHGSVQSPSTLWSRPSTQAEVGGDFVEEVIIADGQEENREFLELPHVSRSITYLPERVSGRRTISSYHLTVQCSIDTLYFPIQYWIWSFIKNLVKENNLEYL